VLITSVPDPLGPKGLFAPGRVAPGGGAAGAVVILGHRTRKKAIRVGPASSAGPARTAPPRRLRRHCGAAGVPAVRGSVAGFRASRECGTAVGRSGR